MPGGTAAHAELIVALTAALFSALRGTEFVVRSEAMRVQVTEDEYVYPDLSVSRGPGAFRSPMRTSLLDPVLIVEVLSPTTRAYDLGEKFQLYRGMPSVEGVLFVDSQRQRVEVSNREAGGWTLSEPATDGTVAIPSVGVSLDVDDLYHGVDL